MAPAQRIVLATRNPGKVRELRAMLAPAGPVAVGLDDYPPLPEVDETGITFEENALLKGRAYAQLLGLPVLAEDSGLEVDALGGEPGVHSARWVPGTDADRTRHLLDRMVGIPDGQRSARYVSVIALVRPDGVERLFRGTCTGTIGHASRGEGGFGYDPVFVTPAGRTMAELTPAEKNAISHRGQALDRMLSELPGFLAAAPDQIHAAPATTRILIVSDTHGDLSPLAGLPARLGPVDYLLHAGDLLPDAQGIARRFHLPATNVHAVVGNCDYPRTEPVEITLELAGVRILLNHGHQLDVKRSLQRLAYRAQEEDAVVAIFGHSHVAVAERDGDRWLFNPGSPGQPRRPGQPGSVGLLTVSAAGVQVEHVWL